jgi:hypothetical protein
LGGLEGNAFGLPVDFDEGSGGIKADGIVRHLVRGYRFSHFQLFVGPVLRYHLPPRELIL